MKTAGLLGAAVAMTISAPYLEAPKFVLNQPAQPDRLNRLSQKKRRQRQRWNNTK